MRKLCAVPYHRIIGLLLLVFTCMAPNIALADDIRPYYIEITEQQPEVYKLRWRVPPIVPANNIPNITMPEHCRPVNNVKTKALNPIGQALYKCESGIAGEIISFAYPNSVPAISTIFKYTSFNGEYHTKLIRPGDNRWQIPTQETVTSVAKDYTRLGISHIWMGMDHLLFVVCLIWIAGTGRRMFITITGFTLAHSVTLFLSALNIVTVPVPPVEAVIALSIVFLAVEISKNQKGSLTWRHPIAVSSSFGLLHGFGFAAALAEIGLPQTELVTGLLFFNVGVEIGQVIFAVCVIALITLIKSISERKLTPFVNERSVRQVSSYAVGILASYWLIERCAGFV